MSVAPRRIWAFHDGPMVGLFVGQKEVGTNVSEYVRADLYDTQKALAHECALDALAASGQAQEAWEAQVKAEAERDKLRDALEAIERGDDSTDGMQGDIARAALKQEDEE